MTTIEDMERASDMAHHAATDEQYFIDENLKEFDEILKNIETVKANRSGNAAECCSGADVAEITFFSNYSSNPDRIDVGFTSWFEESGDDNRRMTSAKRHLTDEEIAAYEKAVKIERAKFEKRLNAYLKRYGLSKLHTWSYLSD